MVPYVMSVGVFPCFHVVAICSLVLSINHCWFVKRCIVLWLQVLLSILTTGPINTCMIDGIYLPFVPVNCWYCDIVCTFMVIKTDQVSYFWTKSILKLLKYRFISNITGTAISHLVWNRCLVHNSSRWTHFHTLLFLTLVCLV